MEPAYLIPSHEVTRNWLPKRIYTKSNLLRTYLQVSLQFGCKLGSFANIAEWWQRSK